MVVQFLLCLSLYAESALVNGPSASMLHVPWMCVNAEAVTAVLKRRKGGGREAVSGRRGVGQTLQTLRRVRNQVTFHLYGQITNHPSGHWATFHVNWCNTAVFAQPHYHTTEFVHLLLLRTLNCVLFCLWISRFKAHLHVPSTSPFSVPFKN